MADWRNRLQQIVNKIKHQLNARGVDSVEQLKETLISFDKNQNGVLEKLEFNEFLSKLGIFLATQELRTVYDTFDLNKDGVISFAELINGLRNSISAERQAIIEAAWDHISQGNRSVSFDFLKNQFRAEQHPRSTSREKKVDDVFNEFVTGMSKFVEGGDVDWKGFLNFYLDFNCVLPTEKDTYFILTVQKVWSLKSNSNVVSEAKISQLESNIFEKIRQRTHGSDDEGKTTKRFFKHFDIFSNGFVNQKEFKQALEALGCQFSQDEQSAIFNNHANENGNMNYDAFANKMLLRGTGNIPNINPIFGLNREVPNQIIDKIRASLLANGIFGVRSLIILFKRFDTNSDASLDRTEMQWVLKQSGQNLSPSEYEKLFRYFDKNNNGKISSSEFIRGVRGELSKARSDMVQVSWWKISPKGGKLQQDDFLNHFDFTSDESFRSGKKSRQEVVDDLIMNIDQDADGAITETEFFDFYTNVSPSFKTDQQFQKYLHSHWGHY